MNVRCILLEHKWALAQSCENITIIKCLGCGTERVIPKFICQTAKIRLMPTGPHFVCDRCGGGYLKREQAINCDCWKNIK